MAARGNTTPKINRFSGAPDPNPSRGPPLAVGGMSEAKVWEIITDCPIAIYLYSSSMVEIPRVISSSTSKSTRTVSRAVKMVTLFSTAQRRMP